MFSNHASNTCKYREKIICKVIKINNLHTWCLYSLIMIRVNADFVSFLRKRVFAMLDCSQFVVRLQIWPTPKSAIDHVRQTFAAHSLDTVVSDTAWARPFVQKQNTRKRSINKSILSYLSLTLKNSLNRRMDSTNYHTTLSRSVPASLLINNFDVIASSRTLNKIESSISIA